MEESYRIIEIGGRGIRRADTLASKIINCKEISPVEKLEQLINFACGDLPRGTLGIGYIIAGVVKDKNIVIKAPNVNCLKGEPHLGDLTRSRSGYPTLVFNDMETAVMGMKALMKNLPEYFMGITWSSGIGLRIFKYGEILCNSEGGHVPLDPSPYAPLCGCGKRGCAESILGGKALERRVMGETQALGITIPPGVHPCSFLDRCFDNGEEWAINLYSVIATGMATFLANIQTILHLPAVAWKGTFAKCAFERKGFENQLRQRIRDRLMEPSWEADMKFYFSPDPEYDAFIGAAIMMVESGIFSVI